VLVANDDDDATDSRLAACIYDSAHHGPTADGKYHLGEIGLHPGALARGQNDG